MVVAGPNRLRELNPDASLVLDAHDEYWGGRPPIRTLRFLEVPEAASRIAGLQSGEYQLACDIPPDQISAIDRGGKYKVQAPPALNPLMLSFHTPHTPLSLPP